MAQLKDTVVTGNLRVTNKILTDSLQLTQAKTAVTGTGTVGSTDGSTYYPSKWTFDMGVTLQDGVIVTIIVPVAGHANGVYVSVDNGTTYKPVVLNGTAILTTHYAANMPMVLIYDEDATTSSMAPLNGGAKAVQTGGAWRFLNYYDTNTNVTQSIKTDNTNRPLLMSNYAVGSTSTSATTANRAQTIYANASTGTITATAFNGEHKGTINSATTATTQSQGDNSTKVATTAYVDTALGSVSDTKNTAGSTNSTSKLYLIGALEQSANPQTYSNSQVFIQNNELVINNPNNSIQIGHNHIRQNIDDDSTEYISGIDIYAKQPDTLLKQLRLHSQKWTIDGDIGGVVSIEEDVDNSYNPHLTLQSYLYNENNTSTLIESGSSIDLTQIVSIKVSGEDETTIGTANTIYKFKVDGFYMGNTNITATIGDINSILEEVL